MIDLNNVFEFHAPSAEQVADMRLLRDKAKEFASAVLTCTPVSADQTAAVRKIREALMTANAAIVLGGK